MSRKESKRYPGLFVLKYKNNVFYDNLWHLSPFLNECRGLVVDHDYRVVIKPFTKVFNHHENDTDIDRDELCTVVRKVNGFMGVATYDPQISENLIYSTTGSLDSDFVDLVEKHVAQYEDKIKLYGPCTLIFEICDETDPHIIKEELGAWLIGGTFYDGDIIVPVMEGVLDHIAYHMGCKRPEHYIAMRFSDVVQLAKTCKHEGFMVYGNKTSLKIKSPYYLITKFLARAGEKKLLEGILSESNHQAKQRVEEEFYPLIDFLFANKAEFLTLDEQARINIIRGFLEDK